jgi:hypothetical protein
VQAETSDEERAERPEVSLHALEAWNLNQAPYLNVAARMRPPQADRPAAVALHIRLRGDAEDAPRLERLRELIKGAQRGDDRVYLHAAGNDEPRPLRQPLALTATLRADFTSLFGQDNVWQAESA